MLSEFPCGLEKNMSMNGTAWSDPEDSANPDSMTLSIRLCFWNRASD